MKQRKGNEAYSNKERHTPGLSGNKNHRKSGQYPIKHFYYKKLMSVLLFLNKYVRNYFIRPKGLSVEFFQLKAI